MKTNLPLLGTAMAAIFTLSQAFAGTTQTVTVTANIPAILALETSGTSVTFNLTDASYNSGANSEVAIVESAAAHTLRVRANVPWTVSVKAGASTFSGPTGTTKPAGDLEVKAASGSYAAVTTSDATLKTGTAGGFGVNTFNVDYRLTSSIVTDLPGAYTLPVVYTVTTP